MRGGGYGVVGDIVVGIVGSFLGGYILMLGGVDIVPPAPGLRPGVSLDSPQQVHRQGDHDGTADPPPEGWATRRLFDVVTVPDVGRGMMAAALD